MPLAELQRRLRDAVVRGDGESVAPFLRGGGQPSKRLDIHRRHYEESLTAAVVGRFPATGWLVGSRRIEAAARAFVHAHPPTAPCIAEYGPAFPGFLATWPETERLTYVPEFADLDWHLGRLAVSVDVAAVEPDQLRRNGTDALPDMRMRLQSGMHYVHAAWGIDTLIKLYIADTAPDTWTLQPEDVYLEVRGSRGAFGFSRLNPGAFAFRVSLMAGATCGEAAARALDVDATFDPGAALLSLMADGVVTSVHSEPGDRS